MIRQRIHKVEVEVAQELWVVLTYYEHNVDRSDVEAAHGR